MLVKKKEQKLHSKGQACRSQQCAFFQLKTCSNNTIRRVLMISEKSVQSGAGSGYRLYMRSQKSESIFFTSKQPKFETRERGNSSPPLLWRAGNHLIIHTYSTYSIYKERSFVGLSPSMGRKQQQPHGNKKIKFHSCYSSMPDQHLRSPPLLLICPNLTD